MLLPPSCLGQGRGTAPSERINMGFIGLGGQGTGDLRLLVQGSDARGPELLPLERTENGGSILGVARVVERYGGVDLFVSNAGILRAGGAASLGLVPTGTGNDFARTLGIKEDLDFACNVLLE